MLIYNYQKEFLGIDEDDLKALGFSNLQELRAESADFADMFVKTPGHVHNFTHVHWIDFVTCSDYNEDSKVIIHASGKNYKCTLDIRTAYLVDSPSQKAFLVHLSNLQELTSREDEEISRDVYEKPIPVSTTASNPIFNTPEFETSEQSEDLLDTDLPSFSDFEADPIVDEYDTYQEEPSQTNTTDELDIIEQDYTERAHVEEQEPIEEEHYLDDVPSTSEEGKYDYNPSVASKALGLPVDLIEEFLQDFILQSKEFKVELFESVEKNDLGNVKILSHKLKGVAANLRVEDAFDVLTVINSSDDVHEVKANLTIFYTIISHLAGEVPTDPEISTPSQEEEQSTHSRQERVEKVAAPIIDEDEFIIDFKEENDDLEEFVEPKSTPEVQATPEEDIEPLEFKLDIDEEDLQENPAQEQAPAVEFDKNLAANEIGLDVESYDELLKDFIQENVLTIESINKAIHEEDSQMWRKHAIKLKGMSDNMRVPLFMDELEQLTNTDDTELAKKATHDIATKLSQIAVGES